MDQVKIGKFIAERRKSVALTQMQLAEKLGLTDRAISKWETGKSLPDSSVMLQLCDILKITVNDLLSGEVVSMENYQEKNDEMLIAMLKEKEEKDKMLLRAELIIGIVSFLPLLLATIFVAYNQSLAEWKRGVIVLASIVPFLIAVPFLIKIEQKAGYYKCAECGHCYVPTFKSVLKAPHMGLTRKMTCPNCGKKSWQKKVMTKE
jgi:transcriptional regulator with XRE-family HTH domain/DNA-directed RNA polymerase subunit RPC12/RpoP